MGSSVSAIEQKLVKASRHLMSQCEEFRTKQIGIMDETDCARITELSSSPKSCNFRPKNGLNRNTPAILKAESKTNPSVSATISFEQGTQTPKKLAVETIQKTSKE